MSSTALAAGTPEGASQAATQLTGGALWLTAILLAVANFLAVLDTSIANVSVSNIAGGLGSSNSEGTWVITSYAVAEAIIVPLTGWLVSRFGTVRVFLTAMTLFGICSALCGLAWSMNVLVAFRVLQGMAGGPLMPLSQTLLMQIFPKRMQPTAMTLWAMTTLAAPIAGPILGGLLCDNVGWPSIFWVNVPIALSAPLVLWRLIRGYETPTQRVRVDGVGLGLLVVWVGALQIVLDLGKDRDWFASNLIVTLSLIAVIGFVAFLIWELTEKAPIVQLAIFRHRGFSTSMITLALAFGAFFAGNVLTPLWLQTLMGYTATWAGYATAGFGVAALLVSPVAGKLTTKVDPRWLVFAGVAWLALICLYRTGANADMTFGQVAFQVSLMGFGLPLFFLPLTTASLGSVEPEEVAAAAGLQNFIRTLAGAVGTSVVNTVWENNTTRNHAELAGILNNTTATVDTYVRAGLSGTQALHSLEKLVNDQAIMLSTNHVFLGCAAAFGVAACAIWLSPRPRYVADTSAAH
jgi:MFS transporter, DHA2 family, multidrug resistance protein